jgi:hypothetical protein
MFIRDFTMTGFEFVSKKRPCCRFSLESKDPENKPYHESRSNALSYRFGLGLCSPRPKYEYKVRSMRSGPSMA